jgi:hypothetical protein
MNELKTLLALARRRLELGRLLSIVCVVGIGVFGVALALVIADRLPAASFVPWMWAVVGLAAVGAITSFVMWMRARPDEMHVAVCVDDRLDLREKISTALHVYTREDSFAQAAVEDAVKLARDPKSRDLVRKRFPVKPPHRWWVAPLLAMVTVGVWFLPPLDLFAVDPVEDEQARTAAKDVDESLEAIVRAIEEQPELSSELKDMLEEMTKASKLETPRTAEQIRRDAIKKVTDLNRKLNELMSGEKAMANDQVEKALKQLQPKEGAAFELTKALAQADFKGAQQALQQLQEALQNGELNEEQREQVAQALEQAAQQLEQILQQQDQLAQALENAGLDAQLVNNPQALQQAIQNNPNLNEQQKQQLQQMVQAQQQAQQMCQGLCEGLGQMAQAMQGQQGEGAGDQLGEQLNQLEMAQQMLQQAQAAANACQGQCQGLGQGLGMQNLQQLAQGQGGAFGQRGQGAGGQAPKSATPFGTKVEKSDSKLHEGDVIGRQLVAGPLVVGESTSKLEAVAALIEDTYEEALNEEQLPPKYHDINQVYFGELVKLTEAKAREAKAKSAGESGSSASGSSESKP